MRQALWVCFAAVLVAAAGCGKGDIANNAGATGAGTGGTTTSGPGATGSASGGGSMLGGACDPNRPAPVPEAGHPRLWITSKDLPELKARATSSNPLYMDGIAKLASIYDAELTSGTWPTDAGHAGNTCYHCEWEMETFAFMSLVAPDQASQDGWAMKARKVLMEMIAQAKTGPNPNVTNGPAAADFAISDRSRYGGRSFGVTVDWIYPYLTATDKADIRQVFLRWADDCVHADKTSNNHPTPVGVFNDPALVADREAVRWAANNYYVSHARNLALMALSFDAADDSGGALGAYLDNATGAFLYVTDHLLHTDAQGGLMPEGNEYNVVTMQYLAELLYALHTAGVDDKSKRGPQVSVCENPFYADAIIAYMHSLAPGPHPYKNGIPYYNDFVSYGDLEVFRPYDAYFGDYISAFGPLALAFKGNGDQVKYDVARFIETNLPPGGQDLLTTRASEPSTPWGSIWYFLLMDPAAAAATDPRPALATSYYAPGLSFFFARTGWDPDASYFFWQLPWGTIDHRHGDANNFGLYRKGEWLTTERPGYDQSFLYSPSHNTLAMENDPVSGVSGIPAQVSMLGSQYPYGHLSNPISRGHSEGASYAFVEGDATPRYDSDVYKTNDVVEASRAIVWLKPDRVVVYDRASSKTAARFKRFYLYLPGTPSIAGNVATATTLNGQHVSVTTVLPAGAAPVNDPPPADTPAAGNEMLGRVRVEASGADERFLNVVEGSDAAPAGVVAIASSSGTAYDGALVGGAAVLFKRDSAAMPGAVAFSVPADVANIVVTGLTPSTGYTATKTVNGGGVDVSIAPGGASMTDAAGVLVF